MNKRVLKKISIILACIIGIIFVTLIGFYIYIVTTTKFNINDFEKGLKNNKNITYVSYEELPQDLINAVLCAEDYTFFEHKGYDASKFSKSLFNSESYYRSIEMQLISKSSLLSKNINFRKYRLAYIAKNKLEKEYSKNELLELYLNYSNFGEGTFGIGNASLKYFNKKASELSLVESAALAGLLQAPIVYSSDLEKFEYRKNTILELMRRYGYLNDNDTAKMESITIENLLNGNIYSEIDVTDENEFIEYIKETSEYLKISDQYNINYNGIKYQATKDDVYTHAYTYKIYYNDQEVDFGNDYNSKIYDYYAYYNPEVYYLYNNIILIISTVTPVGSQTTYDIRAFNMNGEALFGDIVTGNLYFDEVTNELSYNYNILWTIAGESICKTAKKFDSDIILTSSYKYKFSDSNVELLEKKIFTIQDFRKVYNCND